VRHGNVESVPMVSRVEGEKDRRIRIVCLTANGRGLIQPIFQSHAESMNEVFSDLNRTELAALGTLLRYVGKHADELRSNRARAKTQRWIGERLGRLR
jgi:DNA-binding MarR family transcriptional regulator